MRFQAACLVDVTSLSFAACGDDDNDGRRPFDTNSFADSVEMTPEDGQLHADLSGKYRDDLANHRGCAPRASYAGSVEPLVNNANNTATRAPSTPANIPGYTCAANEWTQPNEDTSKPIVILVHGNSSGVGSWEEYSNVSTAGVENFKNLTGFQFDVDATPRQQLASKLIAAGYRVYGFDARTDLIKVASDPQNSLNNSANMDHGWSVPMLQSMIKAVIAQNPGRKISLIGHSLGVTEIRDALRRLFVAYGKDPENAVNPFEHIQDLIYLSGANHGVDRGAQLCVSPVPASNTSQVSAYVACELGDREAFQPTYFSVPITGANDAFATPCADGAVAFGTSDACGGNTVQYTTVVMQDIALGDFQDEFVTEASAALNSGAPIDNHLLTLADYDTSGYFFDQFPALFANHFGSARSDVGMAYILQKLGD